MKFNDRIIGILAVLGGFAIIVGTLEFRSIPGQQFGSAFFPRIVGAATIIVGLIQFFTAAPGPWIQIREELRSRDTLSKLMVIAVVIFWFVAVEPLGFLLTTALVTALLASTLGARPISAIVVSLGLPVLLHAIFGMLLRVPLPRGLIEGWLT
ncbi:putative tricarboxylic transport membrane protein [Cohaesibacter sp. ES.047]|uniref:tripartite tricarboxylate transporter TctB family protein n=1 Tax=Cohaesibacter sp. ES.047 TaxID=1798205 RepID=UPI000BB6E44F|nr:tripartite tricarboxylate transporter TctB family protein [Cohaesibacter sp. ES.047]SNY91021.1 putative tricarboxylic transport membrane protein [Cohaesibacter sp. ES.047]